MKTIKIMAAIPDEAWGVLAQCQDSLRSHLSSAIAREYAKARSRVMSAELRSKTYITIIATDAKEEQTA